MLELALVLRSAVEHAGAHDERRPRRVPEPVEHDLLDRERIVELLPPTTAEQARNPSLRLERRVVRPLQSDDVLGVGRCGQQLGLRGRETSASLVETALDRNHAAFADGDPFLERRDP